jgi:hypothetical protein
MFASDIRQWSTTDAFKSHLAQHSASVCSWVNFIVLHHTYKPVARDWRGLHSMHALKRYYMSLGWSAGPHLFICHGAPNPAHDGIFQLTPLNMVGVHAGTCNPRSIGIEVVGNFDVDVWSDQLTTLVCTTIAHLMDWRGLPSLAITGHRNCNSPKTCPGQNVIIPDVRSTVAQIRGR